jgi:hypothetical protein
VNKRRAEREEEEKRKTKETKKEVRILLSADTRVYLGLTKELEKYRFWKHQNTVSSLSLVCRDSALHCLHL